MMYVIKFNSDHLRADLFHRKTAEETQEFLNQVAGSALKHGCCKILISVHASSPLFTLARAGFFAHFKGVSGDPAHKIVLVGDTDELGQSHQYLESLARQQGVNVRQFRDEPSVLEWFTREQ